MREREDTLHARSPKRGGAHRGHGEKADLIFGVGFEKKNFREELNPISRNWKGGRLERKTRKGRRINKKSASAT